MSRPTDWHVVDLGGDPTPGESWGVRALLGAYGSIATTASEVSTIVEAINTTSRSGIWIGQAVTRFARRSTPFLTTPESAPTVTGSPATR